MKNNFIEEVFDSLLKIKRNSQDEEAVLSFEDWYTVQSNNIPVVEGKTKDDMHETYLKLKRLAGD